MPLTASQICTLAQQDARCPGFATQAGELLNMILSDLCQTYDFDVAKQTYQFNMNPSQINYLGQNFQNLPANYLRAIRLECFYVIDGVPYPMIPCDLEEFDMLVEQAGLSNFPVFFATDMSYTGTSNSLSATNVPNGTTGVPVMLFWMVASGAYPCTIRYYSQMADISNPATSSTIPWFPNQSYLRRRLAGELMLQTDDERATAFLSGDEDRYPEGAAVQLRRYLQMKDDKSTRTEVVKLDRRRFGPKYNSLRNTKQIGWVLPLLAFLPLVLHAASI
jgi:hypothetical protein